MGRLTSKVARFDSHRSSPAGSWRSTDMWSSSWSPAVALKGSVNQIRPFLSTARPLGLLWRLPLSGAAKGAGDQLKVPAHGVDLPKDFGADAASISGSRKHVTIQGERGRRRVWS